MIIDFCSVYERYAQDVHRFALYLSGDPAMAEDIVSETFVRAWLTPEEIKAGTAKAYLFTIARNLCRANFSKRRPKVELDEGLPDPDPTPDVVAALRSDMQGVFDALKTLPETDRAALLMHAQDGMSYIEIAEALEISLAAVKVKIHRSRLKLNQIIAEEKTTL